MAISRRRWEEQLALVPQHSAAKLSFMTTVQHLVRNFVVSELPRTGQPIQPEFIAHSLQLPLQQVFTILDELEKNLFFLVRNNHGAVAWAYPVTADKTPHELFFSTGEVVYAA